MEKTRCALAEFIGTYFLTFAAAGAPVAAAGMGQSPGKAALLVAPALVVMAMILSFGEVSGAHINPAVTVAFALRGDFKWVHVPLYWLSQFLGAVAAAASIYAVFGLHKDLGATLPKGGPGPAFVLEAILTLLLVTVILATAAKASVVGNNAALAVAGIITADGFIGDAVSGASMNPARSFGPALLSGHMDTYWIYLAGPLAGAVIATAIARTFFGRAHGEEKQKATGEDEAPADKGSSDTELSDNGPAGRARGGRRGRRRAQAGVSG